MKVSELLREDADVGTLEISTEGDSFVVRAKPTTGWIVTAVYWTFRELIGKRGIKVSALRKKRYGKAVKTELTSSDAMYVMDNRVTRLIIDGVTQDKLQEVVDKAVAKAKKEAAAAQRHKDNAPKRKAEAAKYQAEKRKTDLAGYAEKYGKGTWNRVTYKQEGGDDGYSYVLRVDGRVKHNGLTQREATYYKEREVDEIAKREKLGKYADK